MFSYFLMVDILFLIENILPRNESNTLKIRDQLQKIKGLNKGVKKTLTMNCNSIHLPF